MRKQKGFTLAEVLITLGIVGVISALTLPNMTQNVNQQKVGPTLAKAVNVLETANRDLFRLTETSDILTACEATEDDITGSYLLCLANNSNITANFLTDSATYQKANDTYQTNSCIQLKDGITYCVRADAKPVSTTPSRKYYGKYMNLLIDINGPEQRPNKISKDAFEFKLDLQGSLIPTGGREYNLYKKNNPTLDPDWKTSCNKGKTITEPLDCSGSIADNNWKVIYNY